MTFADDQTREEIDEVISLAEKKLLWAHHKFDGHPTPIPAGAYKIAGFSENQSNGGIVIHVIGRIEFVPSFSREALWHHISLPLAEWKRVMKPGGPTMSKSPA